MKLGTETGSMTNHLYSRATKGQPAPEIGMGATILHWTDRSAATIVMVSSMSKDGVVVVGVKEDIATVISGSTFDGSAVYAYAPDPAAPVQYWRFEPDRGWRGVRQNQKGRWVLAERGGLRIGEREAYRDPSF